VAAHAGESAAKLKAEAVRVGRYGLLNLQAEAVRVLVRAAESAGVF
jgi:hypothetical protein